MAPSEVITILLMMLSPIRIPSLMPMFWASEINSVDAAGRSAGRLNCAVLNALNKVTPSGENALPPTFCRVLKLPFMEKGAFNQTALGGPEYLAWVAKDEQRHLNLMKEAGFLAGK